MSYILEALKKSDQERKRGDVPGLQTVHIPLAVESRSPRLLYAFIVALIFVLAFMLGLLFSREQVPPVVEAVEPDEAIKAVSSSPPPQPSVAAVEAEVASFITQPSVSPDVVPEPEPASAKVVHSQLHDETDIPYLNELPAHVQQSVPHMSFAGHVFSSTPSSRSVIINGASMSEGDTIIDGLVVEQITGAGVIFWRNGELFRVDILQGWSFD